MEISRILSYFDPYSTQHREACDNFSELPVSKKVCIVILTIFAGLATLPLLCLGGLATFRYLTESFSKEQCGVYLEARCPCPAVKKVKLKPATSWNIIEQICRKSIRCPNCADDKRDFRIIVKGLSHKIHCRGLDEPEQTYILSRGQNKIHSLTGYYVYYQLTLV